jgi:hypothetical protein
LQCKQVGFLPIVPFLCDDYSIQIRSHEIHFLYSIALRHLKVGRGSTKKGFFTMKSVPRSLHSLFSNQHRHIKPAPAYGLLVFAFAMFSGQAFGQTTVADQDVTCIGNRSSNLTCTAGEFSTIVAFQAVGPTPPVCTAGGTITYNAEIGLSNSNTARYDIGFFVGQQGNDPKAATAGGICSASVVPTSILPFAPWVNLDTDTCSDLPGSAVTNWTVNNQKVQCVGNASGQLSIPYVVSYDQNSNVTASCTASNVVNGSPSKCNSGSAILNVGVNPVLVSGYVELTKQTNPDGDTTPFFFQTTAPVALFTSTDGGVTFTPVGGSGLVTLQDNQTVRIYMPVLPTTTRTLTIEELLNNNWDSTATIVCSNVTGGGIPTYTTNNANRSISVVLNQTNNALACTVTNRKNPTIAIAKVSIGGTGTFSFTGSPAGAGITPIFPNITTTTANVTVTGPDQFVTAGRAYAISESPGSGFNVTNINCTGLAAGGGFTPNVANGTVVLNAQAVAPGARIICTYTNALPSSDFSITKTNGVSSLISGASTIYTIRATNSGPDAATGAILSDPAVTGLNKTAVACSAAVGNKCVTAPSVAQLEGGTFALPALAAGEFYEITVTATVTATGY